MKNRGGKGGRRAKSASARESELIFAEDEQQYAYVVENSGGGHFRLACGDGVDRLGVLRGSMRRRSWVRRGDIIVVTLRDFQATKADIVHKYNSTEVTRLGAMGEIPEALTRMYASQDGAAAEVAEDLSQFISFSEMEDFDLRVV